MINFPLRRSRFLAVLCVLFFFLISIQTNLYAQDVTISDLNRQTNNELIHAIVETTTDRGKLYEEELLKRSISDSEKIDVYVDIGRAFLNQGDYKRCNHYLNKGITYALSENNIKQLVKLYTFLGNSELRAMHNKEALNAYYNALEVAGKAGEIDYTVVAIVNPNIAIIRRRMGQLDQALKACKEALAIIDETPYKNGMNHVNLLTITSEILLDSKQYDTALKYVNLGLSISNKLDYKAGLIDLYTKKGAVYFYKKNYEEALQYLNTADRFFKESSITNKTFIININYYLAMCYASQKNYEKTIFQLQQITGLTNDDERKNYTRLIDVYKLMALSYDQLGDDKKSSEWYRSYGEIYEKYQANKDEVVNKIFTKETDLLDQQIASLENENANLEDQNADLEDQKEKETFYFLMLLMIISGACIFILYKYKQKQQANKKSFDKLLEKIDHLEKTSKEQEQIKSKDRPKEVIIDDQKVREVLKGLTKLEEQGFYLSTECSLRSMAKKVKTNATYLSKIINTHKGVTYNDYINNLRIDYAVNRIKKDKQFRSFSIKSIATELGYKSDYSFAKHFKSRTGINPSYFIKRVEEM